MVRVALVLALAGCHKAAEAPPSPLQDAPPHAAAADAQPIAIDAAPPAVPPTAVKIVAGAHAACAVMSDATLRCWGANSDGQLGDGTKHDSAVPVTPKLRGVKDVAVGEGYACALIDDTSVACWGRIGFGARRASGTGELAAVPGLRDVQRIYALDRAACASTNSGALVCWGEVDARGHVAANVAARAPTAVPGVDHVVALTSRAALLEDGDVALWLDDGPPVRAGVTHMIELASRDGLVCALGDNGGVSCFGPDVPCVATPKPAKPAKPVKPAKPAKGKPAPPAIVVRAMSFPPATHLAFDVGICVVGGRLACLDVDHECKLVRRALPPVTHMPL